MSTAPDSRPARRTAPGRRGLPVVSLLFIALAAVLSVGAVLPTRAADGARVDVVRMDGTITPVTARYVDRAIRRAERDGAAAVVLELDTPGGLSSAMDDIIRDILESDVPVVVYVAPRGARAASAGVYITYAAHVAAMAPGTNIGSASPVFMDDQGGVSDGSDTLKKKVTNDAVAQIKNLAQLRGRNAEWAEQAVREAVNITADEAVTLKVVDLTAPDVNSLLTQINGRSVTLHSGDATIETAGASIRSVRMTWMEQFLQLVADPTVAYLLLSLGLLGLFIELSHPGVFLPGVVGGLSVLLALFSLGTLPVNWAGVLLIAFAFLLFGVDLFVPSFGSLTIGGVVSFVIGSYLLLGSDAPPGYEIARPVIWTMTACLVGFFVFLAGAVLRARLRPPYSGRQALIGEVGVVRERLKPSGMVFLQGELWQATLASPVTTLASPVELPVGTSVVVNAVEGLRLVVRPATAGEATAPPVRTGDERTVVPVAGTTG